MNDAQINEQLKKIVNQAFQNGIWFKSTPEEQKLTDFGLEPEKAVRQLRSLIETNYRSVPVVKRIVEYTKDNPDATIEL